MGIFHQTPSVVGCFSRNTSAAQRSTLQCFTVHHRTALENKRQQWQGGKLYTPKSISHSSTTALFVTSVAQHRTNSEQHLLRRFPHGTIGIGRKTSLIRCPTLIAKDLDGSPPVLLQPVSICASTVKLGGQRDGFSDVSGGYMQQHWVDPCNRCACNR